MNYSGIRNCDIANGEGVRVSLFVSGCRHHCKGCFNKVAWSFESGKAYTKDVEDKILKMMEPDYIEGLSILGGEPFEPENQKELLELTQRIHEVYPNKTIWCYSGFVWDELTGRRPSRAWTDDTISLLSSIDVLVDGPYIEEFKDITLSFRGSSNQRIIDGQRSLQEGEIVLYELRSEHGR